MEQLALNVELRTGLGKSACRQARRDGLVPGVVFGRGMESVPVNLQPKELFRAIAGEGGQNRLIRLAGGSLDGSTVIVAGIRRDSLTGAPMHVDLHKVNMAEKVHVKVPVRLLGTAAGVREGGLLDVVMHTVNLECLPGQIPEHLDADISGLTIGHSLHVADLVVPAGMKIMDDPKAPVASIQGRGKPEEPSAE